MSYYHFKKLHRRVAEIVHALTYYFEAAGSRRPGGDHGVGFFMCAACVVCCVVHEVFFMCAACILCCLLCLQHEVVTVG
jgi:hypothetical protein